MTSSSNNVSELSRDDLIRQLATLEGKLDALAAIEQAKGAIMLTYGLTANAAFELLRFHSQAHNIKLRVIAAQVASQLCAGPTSPDAVSRFDRLLDEVTRPAHPLVVDPPDEMASVWSQIAADQESRVRADLAPSAPPPGITIAGNVANLPLVYANQAFTELTGYPVDDVLGRNCRFLQGAATNPGHVASIGRALSTGRDVSVVMRNYRSDGSSFMNRVSISPLHDPAHHITHFVATQIEVDNRAERPFAAKETPGLAPVIDLRSRATRVTSLRVVSEVVPA